MCGGVWGEWILGPNDSSPLPESFEPKDGGAGGSGEDLKLGGWGIKCGGRGGSAHTWFKLKI